MRATFLKSLLLTAAVALTSGAGAAIVVGPGPGGSGIQTFGALPGVTEWSTHSVAGGAGDILDTTAFNTAIQLLNANIITTVLGSSATVPPSQNAFARWNSTGFYLQTRPTGNQYTVLMATLQNGTGGSVSDLTISYDWDQKNPIPVNESVAGHRVYYSLSGAPSSWQLIPAFSTFDTNSGAQSLSSTLTSIAWANGAPLYLILADDNGPGSTTDPMEGAYTIDNFLAVTVIPEPATWMVFAGGVLGLLVSRRRKLAA